MNDFRNTLGDFREAVRAVADCSPHPGFQGLLRRERARRTVRLRWAMAGAMAVALAALPFWQSARQRGRARADAELLRQVNAGLSRTIPQAMAPLMRWTPHDSQVKD